MRWHLQPTHEITPGYLCLKGRELVQDFISHVAQPSGFSECIGTNSPGFQDQAAPSLGARTLFAMLQKCIALWGCNSATVAM
jgi:hypothetical protein